jgi:hypothetical protein
MFSMSAVDAPLSGLRSGKPCGKSIDELQRINTYISDADPKAVYFPIDDELSEGIRLVHERAQEEFAR